MQFSHVREVEILKSTHSLEPDVLNGAPGLIRKNQKRSDYYPDRDKFIVSLHHIIITADLTAFSCSKIT